MVGVDTVVRRGWVWAYMGRFDVEGLPSGRRATLYI